MRFISAKDQIANIINEKPRRVKCAYIVKNTEGISSFFKLNIGYNSDDYNRLILFLDEYPYDLSNSMVGTIWMANNACIDINICGCEKFIQYKEIPDIPNFLFL